MPLWTAQAMARLTVASLTEDRYGSVQGNFVEILGTLIACLRAVEANAQRSELAHLPLGQGQVVLPETMVIVEGLRRCIYEIILAFHPYLEAFQFGEWANDVAAFANFKE